MGGVPSELKHLSRVRKRNQCLAKPDPALQEDSVSSGERKRNSLNYRISEVGIRISDKKFDI